MENPIEMDDLGVPGFLLVKLMWTNYRGCWGESCQKRRAQVRAIATLEDVTVDVRDPRDWNLQGMLLSQNGLPVHCWIHSGNLT